MMLQVRHLMLRIMSKHCSLFSILTADLSNLVNRPSEHNLVKRDEGTGRSCSDPLSFASFLAFALAVANLMMGQGRRRKKRSCLAQDLKEDLIMSTSTILTGVVFSYDQSRLHCRGRVLCDTGRQLRNMAQSEC